MVWAPVSAAGYLACKCLGVRGLSAVRVRRHQVPGAVPVPVPATWSCVCGWRRPDMVGVRGVAARDRVPLRRPCRL